MYSHGTSSEVEQFHVTVTFEDQGGKTRLTMHSVWPSAEALEAVRQFGVEKGGNETLERLSQHLAQRACAAFPAYSLFRREVERSRAWGLARTPWGRMSAPSIFL